MGDDFTAPNAVSIDDVGDDIASLLVRLLDQGYLPCVVGGSLWSVRVDDRECAAAEIGEERRRILQLKIGSNASLPERTIHFCYFSRPGASFEEVAARIL
jgi:hypothetical protein